MNGLCINILTKEESLILKAIDKIENLEEKQKTLEEYILITKENYQPKIQKKLQEKSQQYSLKETLKTIESEGSKISTISDLKAEINETKRELNELKTRVHILELTNSQELSFQPSEKKDDNHSTSLIVQEEKSINSMDQIINQK